MSDHYSIAGRYRHFYGASYGSAQTALRRLEEPHVLLSYVSANNRPWDGIENLFIDCGGYSTYTHHGGYRTSAEEYIDWIDEHDVTTYVLRDVPVMPKVLDTTGYTATQAQYATVEMHAECLAYAQDIGVEANPCTVIQGEEPHDYLEHLDMHADAGTLTDTVGIGSLVKRPPEEVIEIITAVGYALKDWVWIHGFGITPRVLVNDSVRMNLDSGDSAGWSYGLYGDRLTKEERMFHVAIKKFIDNQRLIRALFAEDDYELFLDASDVDRELSQQIINETDVTLEVAP